MYFEGFRNEQLCNKKMKSGKKDERLHNEKQAMQLKTSPAMSLAEFGFACSTLHLQLNIHIKRLLFFILKT